MFYSCPADYDLSAFSSLAQALAGIYDKLSLVKEGHDPFATYDKRRRGNWGHYPDSRLVLLMLRYSFDVENLSAGAQLNVLVRGTDMVVDALSLMNLVSSWSEDEWNLFWNTLHITGDVRELLESARNTFGDEIRQLEETYGMTIGLLLQYIGPELQALEDNSADFDRAEITRE